MRKTRMGSPNRVASARCLRKDPGPYAKRFSHPGRELRLNQCQRRVDKSGDAVAIGQPENTIPVADNFASIADRRVPAR